MAQGYPSEPVFRKRGELRWNEQGLRVEVPEDGEYPEPVPPWKHFGHDVSGAGGWFDWMPLRGVWAHYGHMFVWEILRASLGDLTLYESLLTDPGWIRDFNQVYTDFFTANYALLFERAGLPDGVWVYEDLGYRNGLFASPTVLADLVFPFFRQLVVEAGFDALNPMERKALGNDPFAFASDHSLSPRIRYDSYRWCLEAWRERCRY